MKFKWTSPYVPKLSCNDSRKMYGRGTHLILFTSYQVCTLPSANFLIFGLNIYVLKGLYTELLWQQVDRDLVVLSEYDNKFRCWQRVHVICKELWMYGISELCFVWFHGFWYQMVFNTLKLLHVNIKGFIYQHDKHITKVFKSKKKPCLFLFLFFIEVFCKMNHLVQFYFLKYEKQCFIVLFFL